MVRKACSQATSMNRRASRKRLAERGTHFMCPKYRSFRVILVKSPFRQPAESGNASCTLVVLSVSKNARAARACWAAEKASVAVIMTASAEQQLYSLICL